MLGARVIEKHFTLSHAARARIMRSRSCRRGCASSCATCAASPAALGDGVKRPLPSEEQAAGQDGQEARRGARLPRGPRTRRGDVVIKSPADGGLPPYELDALVGRARLARRAPRTTSVVLTRRSRPPEPARGGARRRVSDPLFDLGGRVAVVTGGMGQLGAEYAAGLAARGMRVAIFDVETGPRRDVGLRSHFERVARTKST